jgi:hypothetical protein
MEFTPEQLEAFRKYLEQYPQLTKDMTQFGATFKKTWQQNEKDIKKLNEQVKLGIKGYKDQKAMMEALDEQLIDLKINTEGLSKQEVEARKGVLLKQKADVQAAAATQQASEALSEFITKSGTRIIQGAGQLVKGLQANASSTELAAGLFDTAIDVGTAGMSLAGKGLNALGDGAMAAGAATEGLGFIVGGALKVIGNVIDSGSEITNKLLKFGNEVLQKEVEKTYTAFNQLSASGALFADGMTGMRHAARDAGLTVEQFSKIVTENSQAIASSGLGMTQGAKLIGGALQAGGTQMRKQLLNLGVGFEEQGALVADVIKDMRGATVGPLRASNQQVAEQTMKYAENLKIIASITGEDAKKKMEQVRQQASQLAFQQKLAQKTPEEQAAILRAMGNMNTLQRKNFMDMVNFGTIVNTEGAAAASLSGGLRDSVSEAYDAFNQGNLDDARQRAINAKYNSQMQKDALAQTNIGLAGAANVGGLAQGLAEALGGMLQEVKAATPEAIKAAEEAAAAQKNATYGLTQSVTDAETAAQNLRNALQDDLTPAIKKYSEISVKMLQGVEKLLDELGLGGPKTLIRSKIEAAKQQGVSLSPSAMQSSDAELRQQMLMTGADIRTGKPLTSEQYKALKGGGAIPELKFSGGGISSGPVSGYSATLHGTEAVVPLPDGKNIPVNLDTSSLNATINQQTGVLTAILAAMTKNNTLTSGILQNSY